MNIYKEAINVQDGVNPIAISGLLNRICKQLREEGHGTKSISEHPAVTLVIDKLLDLNGRPDEMAFSKAYDTCYLSSSNIPRL